MAFAVLVLGASAAYVVMHGGEPLDAPAEPDRFYPARPEWFLLPLYKLRMLVPPELEVLVTGVLPVLLGGFLFGLPFVDRGEVRSVSKRIHWIGAVAGVFVVSAVLVGWSDHVDASDKKHQAHLAEARERAERSVELAMRGVPPEGPVAMMMNDPMTRGADVYKQFCTSCHVLDGEGERKSPDHDGFGSRPWILAMLKDPKSDHFFGKVEHDEKMPSQSKLGDEALAEVTEFMFSLGREEQDPPVNAALVEKGADVFEKKCVKCHMYEGEGDDLDVGGPDLTVWASRTWIMRQVRSPGGATQYGDLHKMPAFDDQLDTHDQWMVAGFLRQQRFRTAGVATGAK
ncbi:MAG: c-type cytochrome [Polyangiales bacterium]